MCDTFVASPLTTRDQLMLFAKNSDRQRNEPQAVELFNRSEHTTTEEVACTYISIPQIARTKSVLLCRPFWMWGAEMGVNEHSVAIGNQAVHSRGAPPEEPALTGMDLVRLGLERSESATQALDVMIALLERHGQGGDCGHMVPSYYNNSFLIADPTDAFVLETVGREWLVERVAGIRSISNCYSIQDKIEQVSPGLDALLRRLGCSDAKPTNYAAAIADKQRENRGDAHARRIRATAALMSREGDITVADTMHALRDHGPASEDDWSPDKVLPFGLCIHAGGDNRPAQTTNAMVSELRRRHPVHWVTGTASPCISLFKPIMLDLPLPFQEPPPSGTADWNTMWWRHERLHRATIASDFPRFLDEIRPERDALEAQFRARVLGASTDGTRAEREHAIALCWREAEAAELRWRTKISSAPRRGDPRYTGAWRRMNHVAGITDDTLITNCHSEE